VPSPTEIQAVVIRPIEEGIAAAAGRIPPNRVHILDIELQERDRSTEQDGVLERDLEANYSIANPELGSSDVQRMHREGNLAKAINTAFSVAGLGITVTDADEMASKEETFTTTKLPLDHAAMDLDEAVRNSEEQLLEILATAPVGGEPKQEVVNTTAGDLIVTASRVDLQSLQAAGISVSIPSEPTLAASDMDKTSASEIPEDEVGIRISIPPEVSRSLLAGGQEAVVTNITTDTVAMTVVQHRHHQAWEYETMAAAPLVDISLHLVSEAGNKEIMVSGLQDPVKIEFNLSRAVLPSENVSCEYWNVTRGAWATDGMTVGDLHRDSGKVICLSSHLTIFTLAIRGMLDMIHCTNVNVMSLAGLENLYQGAGSWHFRLPALLLWGLLVAFLVALAWAVWLDALRARTDQWRHAYLHVDELLGTTQNQSLTCAFLQRACTSLWQVSRSVSQAGTWRKVFLLHVIASGVHSVLARERGISGPTLASRVWDASGYSQDTLEGQNFKVLSSVIKDPKAVPAAFSIYFQKSSYLKRVWLHFLTAHPVLGACRMNVEKTAAKQTKVLVIDTVLGTLVILAIFFSMDGDAVSARSPSQCPVKGLFVLRSVWKCIAASCLNEIPKAAMSYWSARKPIRLAPRDAISQKRQWLLQDAAFWMVGSTYTACQLCFVMAFLADLNSSSEGMWIFFFFFVLFRPLFLTPLAKAFFFASAAQLVIRMLPGVSKSPPTELGIDLEEMQSTAAQGEPALKGCCDPWKQKVSELANRGISLRSLLDFYETLGTDVMLHFDPNRSTTHDVVRHAVIPLTVGKFEERGSFKIMSDNREAWSSGRPGAQGVHTDLPMSAWRLQTESRIELREVALEVIEDFSESRQAPEADGLEGAKYLRSADNAYKRDLQHRMSWSSAESTTASISSVSELTGYAYATVANGTEPNVPVKMVTHNWANKFSHLLAALIADALCERTYECIVTMLCCPELRQRLREKLERHSRLDLSFWICCFSVNQHDGICQPPQGPPEDSLGYRPPRCPCSNTKYFDGDLCEINKFDDMMAYLKWQLRESESTGTPQVRFSQVVVVDASCDMLKRIWCVAELVQASRARLKQSIKIHSRKELAAHSEKLVNLDVKEAEASEELDKCMLLEKIQEFLKDTSEFNSLLNDLVHRRITPMQ